MADYQYIDQTGAVVADTADILTDVQNEYTAALGADLVLDPSTPQGVLMAAETLARDAVVRNNAALANQINPDLAGGVYLDAICALTGLERTPAKRTAVSGVVLSGVPGTIIPEGVIARTSAGDEFSSTGAVTIGAGGTATVDFASVEYGAIPCPAGSLSEIVTAVLGWESVDNPAAGVLGTDEQSDQDLRSLRRNTMALQGVALPEAITSALYNVEGVTSLVFRENVTSAETEIDGVTMAPHSVYVCVAGGADAAIAAALLANKSLGCGWNLGPGSNVTVNVIEPTSGQSYAVKFDRPGIVPIKVRATVKAMTALVDPATAVRKAITAYAAGDLDGQDGFVVGADVSPFDLSGAVAVYQPGIYVKSLEVATIADGTYSTDPIAIGIWQRASITESNITVTLL